MTPADLDRLDWGKGGGLLPAIVQDAATGTVLMLGYMNRDALERTLSTGRMTFFSRSRRKLWVKGETSGNGLTLESACADCDGDAILVRAKPAGPVCHTGLPGCFSANCPPTAQALAFLSRLEAIIAERLAQSHESSYTARLHRAGIRRIAQKVGEEGLELALAAAGGSGDEVVAEAADLLFHVVLALQARGLSLAAASAELERRHRGAGRHGADA